MASKTAGTRTSGTSLQGKRTSYYSQNRSQTRTITYSGNQGTHMAGTTGNQVRYQSPSGQRVTAQKPSVSLPSKTYHRIVLAEFAVCVLLIGMSPILTPRTGSAGQDAKAVSLSGPLVRLTAVCIVFFILALMTSGPRTGRVAAAFGGLVMLGTLLNTTDMFTALGKLFTGGTTAAAAASPAAGEGTAGPVPGAGG